MKKYLFLFVSIFALVFISCKSTPKAETAETPAETTQPAEQTAEEKAPEEAPAAADYTAENQQRLDKLLAARQSAIDAGAPDILADQYNEAEAILNNRKDYVQSHLADASVSSEIDDLALRYKALASAAEAYSTKLKIDEMGLAEYDKADYDKGEASYKQVVDLYTNGSDNASILAAADAGKASYAKVLLTGLKKIAANARTEAITAKKNADSVYAGVSEKEIYKSCADKIIKADSNLVTGDPEAAFKGYKDAAASFTTLYESVSKKRAAAQARIDEAKQAVEKAKNYASQADEIAPLAEPVDGIEDENAVLLEEDTYNDPNAAVIDVDETAEGKEAAKLESLAGQEGAE